MRKFLVGAALVAAAAAPAAAQESVVQSGKPSVFSITPYVGYVFFGDLFTTTDGSQYTQDNNGIFGAEASLDLGRAFSIVGNFGYAKTHFEFERPASGGTAEARASADVADWLYDGSLRFKLPIVNGNSSFAPYAQVGVGATRYTFDLNNLNDPGAQSFITYNGAIGTTWRVGGVGLRGEVKDYITSLDWKDWRSANDFNDVKESRTAHNIAVSLGLSIGF